MARATKSELMDGVLRAFEGAGYQGLVRQPGRHPLRLTVNGRGVQRLDLSIYIWNITHGGGLKRHKNEYRIQVTGGISQFKASGDETLVILGWSSDFGVYVGFDANRHAAPLGASPSMQINKAALLRARDVGVALYERRNGEIAIAVHPKLLGYYTRRISELHDKLQVKQVISDMEGVFRLEGEARGESYSGDLEVITDTATKPSFGDPNEILQRKTILERLDTLERSIGIRPDVNIAGLGHNNPPEKLDDVSVEDEKEVSSAIIMVADEVSKATPDTQKIAAKSNIMARIVATLLTGKKHLASFGSKVKDEAAKKSAALLVSGAGPIMYSQYPEVEHALKAALFSIKTWLRMVL